MASDAWVVPAYDASVLIGALVVIYVMQKTEHDRINKIAPVWLQWGRRASFIFMAMLLCNSVLEDASRISLMLLVWSGIGALVINAVALYLRTPPAGPPNARISSGVGKFHRWAEMFVFFRTKK